MTINIPIILQQIRDEGICAIYHLQYFPYKPCICIVYSVTMYPTKGLSIVVTSIQKALFLRTCPATQKRTINVHPITCFMQQYCSCMKLFCLLHINTCIIVAASYCSHLTIQQAIKCFQQAESSQSFVNYYTK